MSELNYEKVFNVLVQKTKDYIVKNNLKSMEELTPLLLLPFVMK